MASTTLPPSNLDSIATPEADTGYQAAPFANEVLEFIAGAVSEDSLALGGVKSAIESHPVDPNELTNATPFESDLLEALSTPAGVATTQSLFADFKILARAMDGPGFTRNHELYFEPWDRELQSMRGEGLRNASSTLLIPGMGTRTYKNIGLLMDSDDSQVVHVSESDSGSCADSNGRLIAGASDLGNLQELAAKIVAEPTHEMNEVNAHFSISSLRGIFAFDGDRAKLNAVAVQRHLQAYGFDLPIYTYDQSQGALIHWQVSSTEVEALVNCAGTQVGREIYAAALIPAALQ